MDPVNITNWLVNLGVNCWAHLKHYSATRRHIQIHIPMLIDLGHRCVFFKAYSSILPLRTHRRQARGLFFCTNFMVYPGNSGLLSYKTALAQNMKILKGHETQINSIAPRTNSECNRVKDNANKD